MHLSWGGKGGVPLETIYGVTKGIKTEVSIRMGSSYKENLLFENRLSLVEILTHGIPIWLRTLYTAWPKTEFAK